MEKSDELVVHAHPGRSRNQHSEDQPRAIQTGRLRWRDSLHSREDDVRYEAETARTPHQRRAPKAGEAKRVYEGSS